MNRTEIEQRVTDFQWVFGTEQGKRVLNDLEKICYGNSSTYKSGDNIYINEGKRQVLLYIQKWMNKKI